MFNWLSYIVIICIALIFLIPLGVSKVIVYIRDVFLPERCTTAWDEKVEIENDITDKHQDWSCEEIMEELYKSPKWVKAKETYNRYYKYKTKIYTHCNSDFNRKSWVYHVLVLIPAFIGIILSTAIICQAIISTPIEMYQYTHWDKKYTYYMNMEHPTYTDCIEAERANTDLEGLLFIKKEYINNCEKINTEELWSRFYSNVKLYTDTLEGGLFRLAESQNELAKTLEKLNELRENE